MTILLQDHSDKIHHAAVSRLEFFSNNLHGVMLWPLIHCFRGQNWRENFHFEKIVMTGINQNLLTGFQHTLLIQPIGPRKEINRIFQFFRDY